jgi:hypothetical protein|tara:strand:+ start:3520 stop:3708 length:189 start_codon:yes stop_codon:yes gene_type:complete
METFVEHVWIDVSKRTLKVLDNEGYEENIQWKFDQEGAEGFSDTLISLRDVLPEDKLVISYS